MNRMNRGIEIIEISNESPLYVKGVRQGDIISKVNGRVAVDAIDLLFVEQDKIIIFEINGKREVGITKSMSASLGIEVAPLSVKHCKNNCIFCFVRQMPRGLRRQLYVNDEDYRMSFLYGSYITMTSLKSEEIRRIIYLHLAPLYVSVHAISKDVREKLLRAAPDNFLRNFNLLSENGIEFHSQIVVVPGYNDGAELEETLDFLISKKNMLSTAVVPVGVTRYRKKLPHLNTINRRSAREILSIIDEKRHYGRNIYAADELFLRAEIEVPQAEYYDDFPQIENGVGQICNFIDKFKENTINYVSSNKCFSFVTAVDFAPFLRELLSKIRNLKFRVVPIENKFFGEKVTVAGLLTARDIFSQLSQTAGTIIVIPDIIFSQSYNERITLDGVSSRDFTKHGIKIIKASADGIMQFLKNV